MSSSSTYFSLISSELDTLLLSSEEHEEAKKLHLNKLGVQIIEVDKILEMFCSWLDAWDEQGNEISLRSMITHLKTIWVQEKVEDKTKLETWPTEIHDFDPVTFGLEGKIKQSKTVIEEWCQISMLRCYSMQMQCNNKSCHGIINFGLSRIMYGILINKAAEIVPFKDQIFILQNMIEFMFDSFSRIDKCTDNSKELVEYRNFVYAFYYNATCLVSMYWAKEANEETATEMNIALFDMLHKIKPYAAHVTSCYFVVLKSNNLIKEEEEEQGPPTPASFVDFFFEHTILKDDFLILRQRLVFLFTYLADAPQENAAAVAAAAAAVAAEEEYCLIRSQIYALFSEHADPISEAFSNKMTLLSDVKIKIDALTAKIIRLWCKPYSSWNTLEADKMNNIYFVSLRRELSSYKQHTWSNSEPVQTQVNLYLTEIRFLRSLFFHCFETWDDGDEQTRLRSHSVLTSLQRIWGQEDDMRLPLGRLYAIGKRYNDADWEHLDVELKEKFQMSKQVISAWLVSMSYCSFHTRLSTSKKILKFLDSILYNMSHLVTFGACKDVAFQKQIEILEEKLLLLKNLLTLATNCAHSKHLAEFNMLAGVFANNAACLIYLYWAKEANGEIPAETNLMISNMLQKIKPNTPHVARIFIGTLKAICLQPCDFFLLEQTVMSFVDYFFEDLVAPWKNDFQNLRDELIFHLTFVHHHHCTGNAEEIICIQLDVLFSDGVYDLLPFDDMKGHFSKKKVGLSDFVMNIRKENAMITQHYCKFPDSFLYNFPRIIGQGFLDCLIHKLRNLKERMIIDQKYVPFSKYKIMAIEEELVSLTPIFNQIFELKEQNKAWSEVVNVIYLADHVISLCFIFYQLIWHYIPYVSDVVNKIKVVKTKLEKIEECNMYNSRCISHSADLIHTVSEQDQNSENGVVVGFEVDEKIIIDNITRGTESLDIVSIVGMGGLGKTTLAKKVYGSFKSNFNVSAFITVSQDHNKRRLLLDLLRSIVGVDDKAPRMTEDDLAHKLKKSLSRQKYFIVLDDIWNINAWYDVRSSFPNDHNGSRVMFTTRSLEVAKRGQIKCTPHRLSFLSVDES